MRRTVPPSAEIEDQIDQLLAVGVGENPRESLSGLAKLGARLIIQRAVEDEFDAWLGRARYDRRPEYQRGLRNYQSGLRNGFRPRKLQTAEGELPVEIPQVRQAAEPFVSKLFPRGTKLLRTEPLQAMVIGAFVSGLSMRDVESLCEKAGPREALEVDRVADLLRSSASASSSSSAATYTTSAWPRCSLTRCSCRSGLMGPRRACLSPGASPRRASACFWPVMLGMRESHEDWLALGRDLIARGLGAPLLDRRRRRPRADQGRRAVLAGLRPPALRRSSRVRNLLAKLPERERERVRAAYWQALDEAINERDGRQRLKALVRELDKAGFTAAAKCLNDDLDALVVHLRYPTRHRRRWRSTNLLERSLGEVKRRTKVIGRLPRRDQLPHARLVRARPLPSPTPPTASGSPSSSASGSGGSDTRATDRTTIPRGGERRVD